jgi:hypothetical protein
VYVIGEEGILKELELAGFQYLGGPVSNNATEISHSHGYQSVFANFDRAKSLKVRTHAAQISSSCCRQTETRR